MRLEILEGDSVDGPPARWAGALLCRDVIGADGRPVLLKGHRLERADALTLEGTRPAELHLLWLEPGDVDEDSAAIRIARAVAGPGVEVHHPVESQVRLSAAGRGLLRIDVATLDAINAVDGVTVFALADGMPVDAGKTLAGVKITPLSMPETTLAEVESIAAAALFDGRILTVRGFERLRLAAVVRERLSDSARERFERSLHAKAAWFGGSVASIHYVGDGVDGAGDALVEAVETADIVMAVGVASVDPLDSTWRDVVAAGADVIRRGLPVHPGSSYWLVRLRGRPVIGVASCGMFSRRSALDLLLTRCFAGEALDPAFLAGLGHGGLLAAEVGWRFPRYDPGADGEAD